MIHVFFTILSVLILTAAIVSRGGLPSGATHVETEVLSEHSEVGNQGETETPDPTETPMPTESPSPQPASPSATPKQTSTPVTTDGWVYPGSNVVRNLPLSLTTSSDSKAVTDWYKARIKAEGYNTTSFIVTSTNDKIYNKLVAAKTGQKIEVVISRDTAQQPLTVTVSITSQN